LTDFRNNFIIGIIATNIFGCSPTNLEQEVIQNTELATLPPQVCNSLLIRTMRNVLKLNDFENRVVEQFIGDPIGCAFPENNFERAKECIENSSGEIIKEALLAAPNLETVINGTFDPETGEILPPPPTPTPTPRPKPSPTPKPGELPPAPIEPPIEPKPTPTPTPTPPPSVPPAFFFGSYQGSFTDTTDYSLVMAFCPNDADIQINISSGTDLSCTSPNCDINGSITFFYDSTPITSSLTGTINENGLGVASLQVQDPNIPVFDVFDFKFSAMQSSMNFFNADYHSSQGCEGSANLFENVPK